MVVAFTVVAGTTAREPERQTYLPPLSAPFANYLTSRLTAPRKNLTQRRKGAKVRR
jgi:hypothetical protein